VEVLIGGWIGGDGGVIGTHEMVEVGGVGGVIGDGDESEMSESSNIDEWVEEGEKYCQFVVGEEDEE